MFFLLKDMAQVSDEHFIFLLALRQREKRKERQEKKRKHQFWVRPLFRTREQKGEYSQLFLELKSDDHEYFFRYFRMKPVQFKELLNYIVPHLVKNCRNRKPVSPTERLAVTLRYLVTGDSHLTIAMSYRMSATTVGRIVRETCRVLWDVLREKGFLKSPNTPDEWKQIANGFEERWNFPNCIGAIDGKHIVMQAPAHSGSRYYNYKGTHSIVLMAVVNADYEFTLVDIGEAGRQSDGGVFANSDLGYAMNNDLLNFPDPRDMGGKLYPYVFVGDEAFSLKTFLVKPYSRSCIGLKERIYNYRLSRARRIVENVFGICASRFRIFRRPILSQVEAVVETTKAVVVLHNFLMRDKRWSSYCPSTLIDQDTDRGMTNGTWRNTTSSGIIDMTQVGSNIFTKQAKEVRDDYRDYFNSPEGEVSWQLDMVTSTTNTFDQQ